MTGIIHAVLIVFTGASRAEGVLGSRNIARENRLVDEAEFRVQDGAIFGLVVDRDGDGRMCRERTDLAEVTVFLVFGVGLDIQWLVSYASLGFWIVRSGNVHRAFRGKKSAGK